MNLYSEDRILEFLTQMELTGSSVTECKSAIRNLEPTITDDDNSEMYETALSEISNVIDSCFTRSKARIINKIPHAFKKINMAENNHSLYNSDLMQYEEYKRCISSIAKEITLQYHGCYKVDVNLIAYDTYQAYGHRMFKCDELITIKLAEIPYHEIGTALYMAGAVDRVGEGYQALYQFKKFDDDTIARIDKVYNDIKLYREGLI